MTSFCKTFIIALCIHFTIPVIAQNIIPLDTLHWKINARNYVVEPYKGKQAIYLQGGMALKDMSFLNGTIEFDIHLKEARGFPGLYFRLRNNRDGEQWYLRPHQSGNPDANQAAPIVNGISPWQLCFGETYSFPYNYSYNDWTHVKLVIHENKAQVFLDHATTPNLSWYLFSDTKPGDIVIRGGGREAFHIADIKVDPTAYKLVDFKPVPRKPIEGLVEQWNISSAFKEKVLTAQSSINQQINNATWVGTIEVEEGTAANISRQIQIKDRTVNTVFAKIEIESNKDQQKLFHFGYSDRVVALLNGKPIYKGNNRFRSRDYRYLGTIGLFDAIYLDLKKGKNTLLMAVSEDFGGWLITGKFEDNKGLKVSQ